MENKSKNCVYSNLFFQRGRHFLKVKKKLLYKISIKTWYSTRKLDFKKYFVYLLTKYSGICVICILIYNICYPYTDIFKENCQSS